MVQETVRTCRAAIYVRLSVEDSHTHSASIETQQMIIAQFLERNPDIQVYDTYIDNGTSGTTFHRPAFQKMLSDIESGFVNCVIVKDLSRLGRNTIDTGISVCGMSALSPSTKTLIPPPRRTPTLESSSPCGI